MIEKGIFDKASLLKHVTLDGVRIHLRVDERKLWINGYYVLYLNKTANTMLAMFIDSCYETKQYNIIPYTLDKLKDRFKSISRPVLQKDLNTIIGIINNFANNQIPIHMVGIKQIDESQRTAPNRMDISLTYNCNNNCSHCYLPKNKNIKTEYTTLQWKRVLDKLWKIGIPQIVFTGGECTLNKGRLVELVRYGKEFICGVITNGTNLNFDLASNLKNAQLDWIQITLDSHIEKTHDAMQGRRGSYKETIKGIKSCLSVGLQTSINMTLTKKNKKDLKGLLTLAKKLGLQSVSTNALIRSGRGATIKDKEGIDEKELKTILKHNNEYAKKLGIKLNWFLPTCYKNLNPIELGFGQRCCSACSVNMMIEPDGNVIPCQSWTKNKLGNILKDNWKDIWNHPIATKIRNFGYAPKKCFTCNKFSLCGGACPLDQICMGCSK